MLLKVREKLLRLVPELEWIKDNGLREKVISTWVEALRRGGWEPEDMLNLPFTLLLGDSPSSFLEHIRAVVRMTKHAIDVIREIYRDRVELNEDYLMAGALLHDVGKLMEYELKDGRYVQTKIGGTLRHPFIGAALAYLNGLPSEIVHIIAFHSHEGDHINRSLEAMIVNKVDLLNFELFKAKGEVTSAGQNRSGKDSVKQAW